MTKEERSELERALFYRHYAMMKDSVGGCSETSVAFAVGRIFGMMHETLRSWPVDEDKE